MFNLFLYSLFIFFPRFLVSSAAVCAEDGSDASFAVYLTSNYRIVMASGCPHYDWTDQTVPDLPEIVNHKINFPRYPTVCSEPTAYIGSYTDLSKTDRVDLDYLVLGTVGIAFNGVSIFGSSDADGEDAYVTESDTVDQCLGHSSYDNTYHYHTYIPEECLYEVAADDAHSTLFGIMADGIPIFGPKGDDGVVPVCGGHVDESYDFYHYHVTSDFEYPYTINCLKGEISEDEWSDIFSDIRDCTAQATQYDYSFLDDLLITSTYYPTFSPTSAPYEILQ